MKSIHGLLLAIGLGIAGALLNFFYLYTRSRDVQKVYFVGIAPDKVINPGDTLSEADIVPVGIPERWLGDLREFAILYSDRQTVLNRMPITRPWPLKGGSLLLRDDQKTTPPQEIKLAKDERAWGIPVDSRLVTPSLISPGDQVWFLAATVGYPTPAPLSDPSSSGASSFEDPAGSVPATDPGAAKPGSPGLASSSDVLGPFTVLAMGNRLSSAEVMKAAKARAVGENVMVVKIKVAADGSLEPRAQKLRQVLERTNYRPMGIQWQPQRASGKP